MLGGARLAQAVGHVVGHHARGHQHALAHQLLRVHPHRLKAPVRAALAARALDRPHEHQAPRRPEVARLRVAPTDDWSGLDSSECATSKVLLSLSVALLICK